MIWYDYVFIICKMIIIKNVSERQACAVLFREELEASGSASSSLHGRRSYKVVGRQRTAWGSADGICGEGGPVYSGNTADLYITLLTRWFTYAIQDRGNLRTGVKHRKKLLIIVFNLFLTSSCLDWIIRWLHSLIHCDTFWSAVPFFVGQTNSNAGL